MLVKYFCVLAIIEVVFGSASYNNKDNENPAPFYELPCMAVGGICLYKNDCPDGKHVGVTGLCPAQEDNGVECCYSISKSVHTCRGRGGECLPKSWNCPEPLRVKASDCASEEHCCVLVN